MTTTSSTPSANPFAPFGVLWRRRLIVAAVLVVGVAAIIFTLALIKPKYQASASVLMVAEPGQQTQTVVSQEIRPVLVNDLTSLVTSATVLDRFIRDLGLSATRDQLRGSIKARVSPSSNIMPITYVGPSKAAAIHGANVLADETTRYYGEIATSRFDSLISDLRGQLATRGAALSQTDRKLQQFAGVYPYVDTKDGDQSVYDRLIKLTTEQQELRATVQGDVAQAAVAAHLRDAARPVAIHNIVTNDPVYKAVELNYARDDAHLQQQQAFEHENYPGLAELMDAVKSEGKSSATARKRAEASGPSSDPIYAQALADINKVDAQLAADRAKSTTVSHELGSLVAQTTSGADASQVAQLRRQRDALQDSYTVLQSRYSQALADRSEAASTGSLVVVDRAADAKQSLQTTAVVGLIALAIATLWAAITIAFLFDSYDRRFVDQDTIESVYGLPVVSSLR